MQDSDRRARLTVGVVLVAVTVVVTAGVVAAGVGFFDAEPKADSNGSATPTPAESPTPTPSPSTPAGGDGDWPELDQVRFGNGSAHGTTTYAVANRGTVDQRVRFLVAKNGETRAEKRFLLPAGNGSESANGTSVGEVIVTERGLNLTVDVVGGGSLTYTPPVDCNTRTGVLSVHESGTVEQEIRGKTVMACIDQSAITDG